MMRSLRKKHLQVWRIWALLIPIGILSAWFVIPKFPIQHNPFSQLAPAYPELVKSIDKNQFTVNLRKNNAGEFQLEWINREILNYPTATVYQLPAGSDDIKKGILVGRIEALGNYRFPLTAWKPQDANGLRLVLYDFIHKKIIDTITF